ncbi:MAG: 16S rRNA processing protein RimM [Clostridia bacterium]|nr:16S rRNA processing protein RimM [Clostridia bacterium]
MRVEIGNIVNTHGIRGEVKVVPQTFDTARFSKLKKVYIERGEQSRQMVIEAVRRHGNLVFIKFKGVENPEDAALLKGWDIMIDKDQVLPLPKDTYYIFDLIGCVCLDTEGNMLGKLVDVLETGAADVYVIKNDKGVEKLVPAVHEFVKDVNISTKTIIINPPVEA